MSGFARIDSVDTLAAFRTALVKFADGAKVALADAEGEMNRVMVWLETEAHTYWTGQIRKRHELVERCKDAVRQKKLFKSPTGNTQSAVEEEKQLRIAQRRLEEAEEKLKNVRRWTPRLQKEVSIYKGGVSRLASTVSADLPVAISRLDKMVAALSAYAALQVSATGAVDDGGGGALAAMTRAVAELVKDDLRPLREKTAKVDRRKAVPGDVRLESWSDGLVSDRERERVAKLDTPKAPPASTDLVFVERTAWQSPRIYLERVAAPALEVDRVPGDSGWFIGRADGQGGPDVLVLTVGTLLESRSDLADVLTLPAGFLVVVDVSGITNVLDDRGVDVWTTT